jgi:hypothetical protein
VTVATGMARDEYGAARGCEGLMGSGLGHPRRHVVMLSLGLDRSGELRA